MGDIDIRPEPYSGEMMLEEGDFLRHLPLLFNYRQRLIMEALVHISDCLCASFLSMHQAATIAASMENNLPTIHRAQISNAAWSIVDDLYAAKNLIEAFVEGEIGPETALLLKELEPAAFARNGMDHLDRAIGRKSPGNLIAAKGARRAIFGSVSFLHVDQSYPETENLKIRWISISAGPMSEKTKFPFTFPVGKTIAAPIDRFQLSAFDQDVDISKCISLYRDWIKLSSRMLKDEILAQLNKNYQNEVEFLLNQTIPSNVIQVLSFEYKGPAD
jgi:hypothetical protein